MVDLIDGTSAFQGGLQPCQLQQPKRCLDLIHLAVDAWRDHGDFVHEAEVLKLIDAQFGPRVRAYNSSTLEGIEYLGGMEAKHRQIAMAQDAAAGVAHGKGMGGIVDHLEAVIVSDALDPGSVTGPAIAVHRHNCGGLRGDGGFDAVRVQVQGFGIDVHKDWFNAIPQQGVGSGNE